MTKPRCEDIGFEHLWEDCTVNITLNSYPPQDQSTERRCLNCGKHERVHVHPERAEWVAYKRGSGQCDKLGYEHVWTGLTANFMQDDRWCVNCGRAEEKRVLEYERVEWREVTP